MFVYKLHLFINMTIKTVAAGTKFALCRLERGGISHGDNDDCLWVTQRGAESGLNSHLDSDMFTVTVVVELWSDRPRFEVQILPQTWHRGFSLSNVLKHRWIMVI